MVYKNIRKGKLKTSQYQRSKIAALRRFGTSAALAVANQASRQIVKAVKRKANQQIAGYIKGRRLNGASTSTDRRMRSYWKVKGQAGGTTHTTTRMIVRRTPRKQRFMRKLFKTNPINTKYVNRFGFSWMGAAAASKTIWYSICHLKFNNVKKYIQSRIVSPSQSVGADSTVVGQSQDIGNSPDSFIYIGKCTFSYELYNPTNYIMTVYIYDLICKRDTPYTITYNDANNDFNNAPEACMQKGAEANYPSNANVPGNAWVVADPTEETTNTYFNTVGMKPTDYHLFNTFWKVKGIKKIVLPPTASHHHVVIYNPKKRITNGGLFYSHQNWTATNKNGMGGLTQATLFGFEGQVACENDQSSDNTTSIGTLPGKLLVKCVKKISVWNSTLTAQRIIQETDLKTAWTKPTIFTDLVEQDAGAT